MGDDTSEWTDRTAHIAQERVLNLMSKCILRRSQLEKIIFTYNNFHRLHPRYKDLAERAFLSEDPLLLWNFENETLLNSQEIDRLMNEQSARTFQHPTNHMMSNPQVHHNNNSFNLVSRIDATYQQVQQPTPQNHMNGVQQGHFPPQFIAPPPADLRRMATAQHGIQRMMANPPPQQMMAPQQQFPQSVMMHLPQSMPQMVPPSHQMSCPPQAQRQQMIMLPATFPLQRTAPPSHVPPMMPPHPHQRQQETAPQAQFQPMMMGPQPPLAQQTMVRPAQLPCQMMLPPPQPQQQMMMAPPQHFQRLITQAPSTAQQTMVQPSQPLQQTSQELSSRAQTSSGYSSSRETPQYQTGNFNALQIVYDASGKAYRQMVVTQKVLVPVVGQKTNTSSGCSTYSRMSETGDDLHSKVGDSTSSAVSVVGNADCDEGVYQEAPQLEEYEDEDCDDSMCDMCNGPSAEEYKDLFQKEHDQAEMQQKTTSSEFVLENTSPENRTPMSSRLTGISSIESESIRVGSASSVDTPEPDADVTITAPSVRVAAPVQTNSKENEWKVVSNNRRGIELSQKMMSQCNIQSLPKPKKAPVVAKVMQEENASSIVESVPEVEGKIKLTKKEKKLLAEAKAKDLETDDAVLEAAFKERQEFEALTGSNDTNVITTIPVKANKKNRRLKQNVIVTSETVSGPQLSDLPPNLFHHVKLTVTKRAKELEEQGRDVHPGLTPIQQEYLKHVLDFSKKNENSDEEEVLNKVKLFLKKRIDYFREKNDNRVFSRITIYEMIFVDVQKSFLPDLLLLNVLFEKNDTKFVDYEEAFISLF